MRERSQIEFASEAHKGKQLTISRMVGMSVRQKRKSGSRVMSTEQLVKFVTDSKK